MASHDLVTSGVYRQPTFEMISWRQDFAIPGPWLPGAASIRMDRAEQTLDAVVLCWMGKPCWRRAQRGGDRGLLVFTGHRNSPASEHQCRHSA
jgi:hypothetical protein